jgi:hypothetical protein
VSTDTVCCDTRWTGRTLPPPLPSTSPAPGSRPAPSSASCPSPPGWIIPAPAGPAHRAVCHRQERQLGDAQLRGRPVIHQPGRRRRHPRGAARPRPRPLNGRVPAGQAGLDSDRIPFTAVLSLVRGPITADVRCPHCGKHPASGNDPITPLVADILAQPPHRQRLARTSAGHHSSDRTGTPSPSNTQSPSPRQTPAYGHKSRKLQ